MTILKEIQIFGDDFSAIPRNIDWEQVELMGDIGVNHEEIQFEEFPFGIPASKKFPEFKRKI